MRKIRQTVWLLMLALCLHAHALDLKNGDQIAIVGSGFADRQQHYAWFESLIQRAFPDLGLTIRNLGFSGDEINVHPRSEGAPGLDYFLNLTKGDLVVTATESDNTTIFGRKTTNAEKYGTVTVAGETKITYKAGSDFHAGVILAYWGFNESFKGAKGLGEFRVNLDGYLKSLSRADYGSGQPRVVLFSPIAHEDLKNSDLPNGSENNPNLEAYAAVMEEIARENHVQFVDLFHLSKQLYSNSSRPLTMNGIHLTEEGDKLLAPLQFTAVFGKSSVPMDDARLSAIHDAVIEKNREWHHRYRTVDQYNIFGTRSRITYTTADNATVLGEELAQRDAKTANRDRAVVAVAQGRPLVVDDGNLPPVREVPTNTPATKPYVDGEEAIHNLKLPEGCKVELVADEKQFPELVNPVQMNFDTKGRLWIAVWPNYPETTPTTKKFDKLLILDLDSKTGKAVKCTTFLDGLNCPTGFQFYQDGVLVMQSPDLWFVRDMNGDGKIDGSDAKPERMLHGLDAADSHHETNSICYEPGGAVYLSDGVYHRSSVETVHGPVRNVDGAIYRFEPRTGRFERYAPYPFGNPHGRVFDYWGNDFITEATTNANYFAPGFSGHLDEGKHPLYKQFWVRPSRPSSGTAILTSRHFPESWQGQFLNANVISLQGIFRVGMQEAGAGFIGETLEPLIQADVKAHPSFRPSGLTVAPDGSIYVMDWSQMLIGHLQHHLRDPNRDHQHGRIYRITFPGRPLIEPKRIDGESVASLLELLKEPENDVRLRAKIELGKHDSNEVVEAAKKWVASLDPHDPAYEHHRLEALWIHQWHNRVNLRLLEEVLRSPEFRARAQGVRVLCYWRDRVPNALGYLENAIKDPEARVRLEAVRALSFFRGSDTSEAVRLARTVEFDPDYYIGYCFKETIKQLASLPEGKALVEKDALLMAKLRVEPDASYGPTNPKLSENELKVYQLGKEVFGRDGHCATCHQGDGQGVEKTYPALSKSEWLEGDPERAIKVVLKGLYGPLNFHGKSFGPEMGAPPMTGFGPLLKDEEIAAVLSYVNQSFGNNLPGVSPEQVKAVRTKTVDRNSFYTVEEILKECPLPDTAKVSN